MSVDRRREADTEQDARLQDGPVRDSELLRLLRIRNVTVILTTTGARTGKLRRIPLIRVTHNGAFLAVASNGGNARNPQWYYNVLAHPQVTLQDGGRKFLLAARELAGEEKQYYWSHAVEIFPRFDEYRKKAGRPIPMFLLQ
jgi:deazaflavin-dependent oxidoreductase (nitroreductase family)